MSDVVAKFTLSDEYYQRLWKQLVRHRTRFRRWTVPFGLLTMVVGAAWFASMPVDPLRIFGTLLFGAGAIEVLWHYWDRHRWFKRMTTGPQANGEVELRFNANGITHVGPTARGEIQWRGIERIIRTNEGLFLLQGRGLSMFVPLTSLTRVEDANIIEELRRRAGA